MDGKELQEWRLERGWSKGRVAQELGCSRNTVRAWEAGQRIPRYVALAVAALDWGLPPWGGVSESRGGDGKNSGGQDE